MNLEWAIVGFFIGLTNIDIKQTDFFSILEKKRIGDEKMKKRFEPTIENIRI